MGKQYQVSILLDLTIQDQAFLKAQRPLMLELGGTWAGVTIPSRQVKVQDNVQLVLALPRTIPASTIKQLSVLWPESITMRLRGLMRDRRREGYRAQVLPGTIKVPEPR